MRKRVRSLLSVQTQNASKSRLPGSLKETLSFNLYILFVDSYKMFLFPCSNCPRQPVHFPCYMVHYHGNNEEPLYDIDST